MKALQYVNNKAVGENLGSLEKAKEYNKKVSEIRGKYSSCISALACENCFHIIHDSICCCVGLGICPNCNYDNSPKITYATIEPINMASFLSTNQLEEELNKRKK